MKITASWQFARWWSNGMIIYILARWWYDDMMLQWYNEMINGWDDFTLFVSPLLDLLCKLTVGKVAAADNSSHVFACAPLKIVIIKCSPANDHHHVLPCKSSDHHHYGDHYHVLPCKWSSSSCWSWSCAPLQMLIMIMCSPCHHHHHNVESTWCSRTFM